MASMPYQMQQLPATTALLMRIEEERIAKRWKASTTLKYAAATAGAMAQLPIYKQVTFPLLLAQSPIWRAGMQTLAKRARIELPSAPVAATVQQVQNAVSKEADPEVKALLLLSWLVAGRTGDVQKLLVSSIVITGETLRVTYLQGKTVQKRGPYSVTTSLRPADALILNAWLNTRQTWAFSSRDLNTRVKEALRRVDRGLECRSLRRGALLAMAQSGIAEEILLEFSGHTTIQMLRRYLGWKPARVVAARTVQAAAAALHPVA